MEISFAGKRVLVTGAGQGIGRATAIKLVECGAKVVAVGRTKMHLDSLQQEAPNVEIISVNLEDWEATRKALDRIGHIDALVNSAAVAKLAPFLEVVPEDFDASFSTNVKAVINVSQIVAKDWVKNNTKGAIVNISSQASQAGLRDHSVYCATKGALDALTRVMALELGCHKIRVNCVNPTVVMTEMGKIGWADPVKAATMLEKIPLGRFAEVHEVVNTILFLLSSKASMITGVTLPVDGGFLAM